MRKKIVIAILGTTGSGKSDFALKLSEVLPAEIVCLDSTTVYREFCIGTDKPSAEAQKHVCHHLIDILSPNDNFSAFQFVEQAINAITQIHSRGKIPLLVGGTYFYLRALENGMYRLPPVGTDVIDKLEEEFCQNEEFDTQRMHSEVAQKDPELAKTIQQNDRYRLLRAIAILRNTDLLPSNLKPVPYEGSEDWFWVKYAMTVSRHFASERIVKRVDRMLSEGLADETKKILVQYPKARGFQFIGYAECCRYLAGKITEKQLRNDIIERTKNYAKRQITWLRSDSDIRYIDEGDIPRVKTEIENLQFVLESQPCVR